MKNKHLFWIWGGLFILCALLGFIPQPEGFLKALLILFSVAFFIPGFVLLFRAAKEKDLSLLKTIPEYKSAITALQNRESVAITGIGQMNRSHMIAGLHREVRRPMVLLCQDDLAARRLQEELKCFLGTVAPILPIPLLCLNQTSLP